MAHENMDGLSQINFLMVEEFEKLKEHVSSLYKELESIKNEKKHTSKSRLTS